MQENRPDEVSYGPTTARRHRRTTWSRGVVVLAGACALLAVVVNAQPDRPDPRVPTRTAPPARPAAGADASAVADGVMAIDTGPYRFSAHAIAVRRGRFVVVGDSRDLGPTGPPVYWSDDGHEWHSAAAAPVSVNVTDVVATRRGFVAVGVSAGDGPGAWTSEDGSAWREVAVTTCTVEDADGGLVARGVAAPLGFQQGHTVRWRSRDGHAWTRSDGARVSALWCDPTELLGHWVARDRGLLVSVAPNGEGDYVVLDRAEG